MKKLFLILILIGVTIGLNSATTDSAEDTIRKYYRAMENKFSLRTAYEMSTKKVSYEKFESWYINVISMAVSGIKKVGNDEYNFIVTLKEFRDPAQSDAIDTYLYNVTMSVKDGKILKSKSTELKVPVVDNSDVGVIQKYYTYMQNKDTLKAAYELSTKKVPFEKFRSWYQNVASISVSAITRTGDHDYNFIVILKEYASPGKSDEIKTYLFDISQTIGGGKIVKSKAIPLERPNEILSDEEVIRKYYKYMANNTTLDKAYAMSVKSVSYEKYVSWYKNVASVQLTGFTKIGAHTYNFIVNYREYENSNTGADIKTELYDVTMTIDKGKIVKSKSVLLDEELEVIEFMEEIDESYFQDGMGGKPVIYLYPREKQDVYVNVETKLGIAVSDPPIYNGWYVTAYPDGKIINKGDGKTYPYLFWEAFQNELNKPKEGFFVEQGRLSIFFDEKLTRLGLYPHEIKDFKEYWLKKLNEAPYYFITFIPQAEIERVFPLTVEPTPDSIIRVMIDYRAHYHEVPVTAQVLAPVKRHGFSVVEWGGLLY